MNKKIDDRKNLIIGSVMVIFLGIVEIILIFGLRSLVITTYEIKTLSNQMLYVSILMTAFYIYGSFDYIPNLISRVIEDTKESYHRLSLNYRKKQGSQLHSKK